MYHAVTEPDPKQLQLALEEFNEAYEAEIELGGQYKDNKPEALKRAVKVYLEVE